MKLALITDTHWGVRNDSPVMLDNMKDFMNETFLPYVDKHDIDHVVHLGDLVDRRKYININTARRLREDFLKPLTDRYLNVFLIAGNHDTYFKNTNSVNSLDELLVGKCNRFTYIINDSYEISLDGTRILFVPWICDENREKIMQSIAETKSQILFGHLELSGFEMYRGAGASHGDDPNIFNKFDVVCSGHYHHRSSKGNIHYLGSPCEFTWADYDDPKGFHVFDTETRELTFIENPKKAFAKIIYDDLDKDVDYIMKFDPEEYRNKFIKVIIKNKINPYWFDTFIERLDSVGVHDMQVVEDHLNLNLEEDADIINEAEDTMTILRKYLNSMSANTDKKRVETIVHDLYVKAQSIE
jgi:DNA repair exonuclease SbcCD nuclease subunit